MTTTNDVSTSSTDQFSAGGAQLAELAARANSAHQRVFKAAGEGLLAAFEAGQSLLEARKLCLGNWLAWLPQNFKGSARTAQRYMAFAQTCLSIGGFDATRVSRLTPHEMGAIWAGILGQQRAKQARRLPPASGEAAPRADSGLPDERDAGNATADLLAHATAIEGTAPPLDEALAHRQAASGQPAALSYESCDAAIDLMPPLVPLFARLIEQCRRIGNGNDCYDGEYADGLADKLDPHYADLLDYMEDRQHWRSRPGYTGGASA